MKTINIAIADDQVLFRKGMLSIVNGFEGMQVTLEADNGRVLLDALETASPFPDVVLLDLSMPELNGVEVTKRLNSMYPALKIIILSVYGEDRFVIHMIDLGVNGFLFKNVEPSEVERAIHTVVEKEFYVNDVFLTAMKNRLSIKKPRQLLNVDLASSLTAREVEILNLICRQLTAQEIADQLNISTRTVDGHRNHLLEKTGARNTAGLVIFAVKNHLLDPASLL
ncbi:response regulator transcription factor [Spirosoma agri]|uniref:Response regulator transcription factor n=1 Tax=Spirosoma agri TaxID=1987381 RepID=A0A6M0IML7_9BACT|nr:response regulator transcription factor [Spirosoma agri]NEU68153.1 response regulator transcription factor [Spirosoma agri]